jgi:hypothetical protein
MLRSRKNQMISVEKRCRRGSEKANHFKKCEIIAKGRKTSSLR